MAGTQHLWLFIVSGLLLNITPGPDSLFIMARSATQGWRAGFVACWGIGSGVFVHVFAAALGLSALLATSAAAFTAVKIVGAAVALAEEVVSSDVPADQGGMQMRHGRLSARPAPAGRRARRTSRPSCG